MTWERSEAELRELLRTNAGHARIREIYEEVTGEKLPGVVYINGLVSAILDRWKAALQLDSSKNVISGGTIHRVFASDAIAFADSGAVIVGSSSSSGVPATNNVPGILLTAAILNVRDKTSEGQLIECVAIPWLALVRQLAMDPDFLYKIPPRKLEELIAASYEAEGFDEVILTPATRDKGRDVIATRAGYGCIRIYDSVKAYRADRLVEPNDVDALLGVLTRDHNVSKGIVTTTSRFGPSVFENHKDFIPHRLELKDGPKLLAWLETIRRKKEKAGT